jgi:hypothetical protein
MRALTCLVLAASALTASADPLSKSLEIDLYRETPNRSLKGLATRSDGRTLPGPTLRELGGKLPTDLLWTLQTAGEPGRWLVGTGPEGKVLRVSTPATGDLTAEVAVDLEATHVFALLPLGPDAFLAGTSPQGLLALVRGGKVVASVALPADSIFDFARLPDGSVLVATGNPGRIYRLDLAKFERAGEVKTKPTSSELAGVGLTQFGEIRDRNVRRLLALPDGRVIAGSAPKGNVYAFPAAGGAPLLLLENREAEVTDLLADADGAFYAALTLSGGSGESRVNRPTPPPSAPSTTPAAPTTDSADSDAKPDRFAGRGQLVYFPSGALPEVVVSRSNVAFYRLAAHESGATRWILIAGGEQGELLAYSPVERRSLNLGASNSAQLNALLPAEPGRSGPFVVLRNNPAGLARLDFSPSATGSLETRKLDLGAPADLGQLRLDRFRGDPAALQLALRTSFGSDELEGWSAWTTLTPDEGGWSAPALRGRYVQLRITATNPTVQLDKATLYYLPQNRRPLLTDFRIFPANLGLIPAPEAAPQATSTLGQLLAPARDSKDETAKRKGGLMNSPIVPAAGAQIVYWNLSDPDDDNLAATFSITPEASDEWVDLAVNTRESYVQFEISHLAEGRYRSRLAVREQAPRPAAQRLSYTFETDTLTIDRTGPEILDAAVTHESGVWRIRVEGRDKLSLLEGAEFVLNNGGRLALEHPIDGILDSRRETFVAEFTDAQASQATSVEIVVYDASGNSSSRRLALK